jgi:hypothetical protein
MIGFSEVRVHEFSVGALRGWHGVLLGLGTSLVLLVAGWQDVGKKFGMGSSAFWFVPSLIFSGGVIWLGIGAEIWGGMLLGITVFCSEVWLILRWWRKAHYI